ncbi:RDD family protein [Streptomyces aureocirculatus]|uniref:RDD family protein n=1 Tax=Streptomyces aureocirculatus TaxID=67275 RepID=UPI0004C6D2C6|nr:RDD family protein [Streptomyces aureocirculatus]
MSAPTPAPGDDRPREGYYPDPSIPGYVRYWNGASWVPGTSRPAPSDGEPLPAPPQPASPQQAHGVPTAAEETGPVFFDEEPGGVTQTTGPATGEYSVAVPGDPGDAQHGSRPEPATAWLADSARQTGLGGEQDQRVSWGSPGRPDPRVPGAGSAPGAAAADGGGTAGAAEGGAPRVPAQQQPGARQEPEQPAQAPASGDRQDRHDRTEADGPGTVTIRAVKPGVPKPTSGEGTVTFRRPTGPVKPAGSGTPGADGGTDGTMSIRAVRPKSTPSVAASGTGAAGAAAASTGAPAAAQAAGPQAGPQQAVPPRPAPQQSGPAQAASAQAASAQSATPQSVPPQAGPPAGQGGAAGAPGAADSPVTSGPGGGAASWAQQVHQLAQASGQQASGQQASAQGLSAPQAEGPVLPWKPVAADPFAAVVQAQASARPAALGKRFAARLIDTVVLAAVTAGAALPLGMRAADHIDSKIDAAKLSGEKVTVWLLDGTTAGYLGTVLGVLLLFGVLYEALPTAKWGRTLGKRVCGIEVRDIEEHAAPSFGAALRRWLVYSVPGVLVIGLVGMVWCVFDRPWRQCWHDKAANTFVAG